MTLGMSVESFTTVHVVLSLAGLASGFVVLIGLLNRRQFDGWTSVFLGTTTLTTVTGFGFPVDRVLPSHIVAVLSLIVLAMAILARYRYRLEGRWRGVYVTCATVALYFNSFVGLVQAFQKVPALKAVAPMQNELPFVASQLSLLFLFVVLGSLATRQFNGRREPSSTTAR